MTRRTHRRDFLKHTTLAGVGYWVAAGSARAESKSPNEKLRIACIGVGGKGSSDTDQAGNVGDIVALCDVDEVFLNDKAGKFPQARKFSDFRKLFDEMAGSIDAVTVSTPDHTHAPASMMAMKLGKHVYCQKPLTHSVFEARIMRETAKKMNVKTQMGNQGSAENGLRRAVEIIQAGAIGPVREVHVWTNRPVWPQAPGIVARPKGEEPVPSFLNWDCFIGPAPMRPFHHGDSKNAHRGTYHSFNWRGWLDFGTGALGDMACHTANMAFRALKLGYPTTIEAEAGDVNPETFPSFATIRYEFPARGDLPPVKFTWYEGKVNGKKNLPPDHLLNGETPPGSGSLLVGDKGILYSPNDYGAAYMLFPKKEFAGYEGPAESLPRNGKGDPGMKEEWAAAIKGGPEAYSNFEIAGTFTEAMLLGNVAIRVGKKLEWDGPNMKVTNCSDADQYIKREYRAGWTL